MTATYKVLALGDSVMWGQGLADRHEFVRLVAAYLAGQGKQVELASLAHSGAIIDLAPQLPTPQTSFLFGELPRTYPAILSQVEVAARTAGYGAYLEPNSWDRLSWKREKADLAQQVEGYAAAPPELILLDGGANDFKALQIVLPWSLHDGPGDGAGAGPETLVSNVERVLAALSAAGTVEDFPLPDLPWLTEAQLKQLIDTFVYERMVALLGRVGEAFPSSRVVVTGYYPVFTPGSLQALTALGFEPAAATLLARSPDRDEQLAALAWALHPQVAGQKEAFAERVVWQSALWYGYGTQRLRDAVAEANGAKPPRFFLASPAFGPDNGALAPDSYLWTFTGAVDYVLRELLRLLGGEGGGPAAVLAEEGLATAEALSGALEFVTGYGLGAGIATDEETGARALAAYSYYLWSATGRDDPATTLVEGFTTSVASAGHPNPDGAQAFAAAIEPLVE